MLRRRPAPRSHSGQVADLPVLDERAIAARLLDLSHCPDCGAALGRPRCDRCRADLASAPGVRLLTVSQQAAALLTKRADLRVALHSTAARAMRRAPVAEPRPTSAPQAGPVVTADRLSAAAVQQVLVGLGATLIAIAALVFTVVAWDGLGIGGRAAVLTAVTLAGGVTAHLCARRGLRSTGEALAGLAASLLVLDGYAARAAGLADLDRVSGAAYWGLLLAGVGGLTLAVSSRTRLSATPLAAAVAAGVSVPCLAAWIELGDGLGTAAVFVLGAGALATVVAARALVPSRVARGVCVAFAAIWWLTGVLGSFGLGLAASGRWDDERDLARVAMGAGLLVLAAVVAALVASLLARAGRSGTVRTTAYAVAGTCLPAAVVVVAAPAVTWQWLPTVALLAAVSLWLVASLLEPAMRAGGRAATLVTAALAAALPVTVTLAAGLAPLQMSDDRLWSTRGDVAVDRVAGHGFWASVASGGLTGGALAHVAALMVLAALLLLAGRATPFAHVTPAASGAAVAAAAIVAPFAVPARVDATALVLVVVGTLSAVLLGWYAAGHPQAPSARPLLVTALLVTATGLAWSAASEGLTLVALLVVLTGSVAAACTWPVTWRLPALLVAVCSAVAAGATLGAVVALTQPWCAVLASAVAAVAGCTAGLQRPAVRGPVELVAAALGSMALLGTLDTELPRSVALTLAGAAVSAVSLRGHRSGLRWVAGALLTLATWSRLAGADVSVLEAYTVPFAMALLAVGVSSARRNPALGSWAAYAPGLALALLPSLIAALEGPDSSARRPLLLAVAAAGVTIAGARLRLAAPLAIGGVVLLVDALAQVGPVLVVLPRWAVVGAIGAVLLGLGATYERRLAQVRELNSRLQQLR